MEKFAYVIMMVFHSQVVFDQLGNALCCPQLRPIAVGHGPLGQKANKALLLLRSQLRWSARRRFGFQRVFSTAVERIAPSEDAARVTTNAAGNLMKGQFLFKECNYTLPAFFKQIRRTVRSRHGDTPFQDAPIILHYLCGSQ
jgi:hypothetical protein